jgi:hypothetical protein
MQKMFRCIKLDHSPLMRKRCIERQEINLFQIKYPFLQVLYPECTKKCEQGKTIREELGIKKIMAKDQCKEPECDAPAELKGRCKKCYHKKRYKEKKAMEKSKEDRKKSMSLLNDLEKEIDGVDEEFPRLNEEFLSDKTSSHEEKGKIMHESNQTLSERRTVLKVPAGRVIIVDFDYLKRPELYDALLKIAEKNLRPPDMHLAKMVEDSILINKDPDFT